MMLAAGALALAIPAGASVASADGHMVKGPKVSWKLSLWGKRRAFTEGMEYVSEQVSKKTGGNFTIRPVLRRAAFQIQRKTLMASALALSRPPHSALHTTRAKTHL